MTREEVLELTLQVIKGKMWWATNIELILEVALAAADHEREACASLFKQLEHTDEHIAEVIEAAVQAERESCAQVCLTYAQTAFNNSSNNAAMELHEAIRTRGKA